MFSIERKEEQVLVEAGREFQIEVAVYESEKEKPIAEVQEKGMRNFNG